MIIRFSEDASADLQHISQYTLGYWGAKQEQRYLDLIYDLLAKIQSDPLRWKFRNELHQNSQSALVGKHVIFFKLHEDYIQVARILHQSMDFSRHLEESHFDE